MARKLLHIASGIMFLAVPIAVHNAASKDLKPAASEARANAPNVDMQPTAPWQNSAQGPKAKQSDASKPGPAQLPEPLLTEDKFSAWSLQCVTNSRVSPACQIMYRLMSPDQKQVVLVLSLAMFPKNISKLQMALPLGFSLPQGVQVSFGKEYSMVAQVSRCTVQGCLVEGEGPAKMIGAMTHEKSGMVSVHNMEGAEIQLPISLEGFSAAYDALRKKS